jgi:hypothetical protein
VTAKLELPGLRSLHQALVNQSQRSAAGGY